MSSVFLSDILRRNGLDPKKTKLIRHSLNDKAFAKCYSDAFVEEYQKIQKQNFFNKCEYLLSFISGPGTSAKFYGCYSVGQGVLATKDLMIEGFPVPEMFDKKRYYYDLTESQLLSDLKNRLIINWGKAAISWHQWATNDKEVLAIQENPKYAFGGYEKVVLSFSELKDIIEDPILYENWHTALASVYAIYLITDITCGKQYIGSAYGSGGLLERWKCYIITKDGGNKGMKDIICSNPDRYEHFRFSILQVLPKTITEDGVIDIENLYKSKLMTKEYGMNEN